MQRHGLTTQAFEAACTPEVAAELLDNENPTLGSMMSLRSKSSGRGDLQTREFRGRRALIHMNT